MRHISEDGWEGGGSQGGWGGSISHQLISENYRLEYNTGSPSSVLLQNSISGIKRSVWISTGVQRREHGGEKGRRGEGRGQGVLTEMKQERSGFFFCFMFEDGRTRSSFQTGGHYCRWENQQQNA